MSVSGLCQVCESTPAEDRCKRCGAFVCADHVDGRLGVCVECHAQLGGPDDGRSVADENPDVSRYRF
jgi:hypothetical protein